MIVRRLLSAALLAWLSACGGPLPAADSGDFTSREEAVPFPQPDGSIVGLDTLVLIPAGSGPFPLAVVSHGTPRLSSRRDGMSPRDFLDVGRWLVGQGFAVAIPMRRGYGRSRAPYVEGSGSCANPDYARSGRTAAQDIEAVASVLRHHPQVDPNHIVLIGQSAGGWGTMAALGDNPPGVVAAVLFSPGRGSTSPDVVCAGDGLVSAAGEFGKTARIPTLWVHAENDHFFAPKLAHGMYDAFHAASPANATFLEEPACGLDGHAQIHTCPDAWRPAVSTFLHQTVRLPAGPNG